MLPKELLSLAIKSPKPEAKARPSNGHICIADGKKYENISKANLQLLAP